MEREVVGARLIGDVCGGIDRLGHAHNSGAKQIEGAVVGDAEQPGTQWRRLLLVLQCHECPDQCVLHDVLALDDRSHETGAIAVQFGPKFIGPGDETRQAFIVLGWPFPAHAAASSMIVIPVSPLRPKASA